MVFPHLVPHPVDEESLCKRARITGSENAMASPYTTVGELYDSIPQLSLRRLGPMVMLVVVATRIWSNGWLRLRTGVVWAEFTSLLLRRPPPPPLL